MNLGPRLRVGAVGAGVVLLLAGCTSGSADAPPTSPVASPTVSPSVIDPSSLALSSSSAPNASPSAVEGSAETSLDAAAQEAADRAAIEAQWVHFWEVYQELVRTPPENRQTLAESVAVAELASKMVTAAEKAEQQKKDNYGSVVHHIFWQFDVAGKSDAVVADCLDQSNAGTVDTSTGSILTVGPQKANMRGELTRGTDGIWRVKSVTTLNSTAC